MSASFSELLKKYDVPGPRYTSYPTVPYWAETPTEREWLESITQALHEANNDRVGAAIYIHIPFCDSLCTYCGCNTRITRNRKVVEPYIESVLKEWEFYVSRLGARISLSEIHLGGGTPTFLLPAELEHLIDGILKLAHADGETEFSPEFSIEADPRVTTPEHLRMLAKLGFRRLSLGIQDFDPRVQEIVHRVQSEEQVEAVTEYAREQGFTGVNYDLIYGLPLQTGKSVEQTIEAVKRLRPDRIAFYGYAHVPWIKPGHRRFTEDDIPSGDEKRALYEVGRSLLCEVGYKEVGMDHFALETDSLWKATLKGELHRNFMGYAAKRVSPQIGLGVSAIGDSWRAFAQNEKLPETYSARIAKGELPILRGHLLNEEDQVLRRHVLNIMTRYETRWDSSSSNIYTPFLNTIPERCAEFVADGLVLIEPGACKITEKGKPFLRNICMAFDARLVRQAPTAKLFSKTI